MTDAANPTGDPASSSDVPDETPSTRGVPTIRLAVVGAVSMTGGATQQGDATGEDPE